MGKPTRLPNPSTKPKAEPAGVAVDSTGSRIPWFAIAIAAIVAAGLGTTVVLAQQRETVVGIAPEALKDHWQTSFSINSCGEWLPPTADTEHGNGIHSHADGLIHVHPSSPAASGPNATLGEFLETAGAALTDEQYVPGRGEVPTVLDESSGCDGQPSELVLGVWSNEDPGAEPEIIRTGLADYRFRGDGEILTLALLPEGDPVPQSPTAGAVNDPADVP